MVPQVIRLGKGKEIGTKIVYRVTIRVVQWSEVRVTEVIYTNTKRSRYRKVRQLKKRFPRTKGERSHTLGYQ